MDQEDIATAMNGAARQKSLAEMNAVYCVVKDGGRTKVLSFERHTRRVGQATYVRLIPTFMSFADFAHFHCNQTVNVSNNGRQMPLGDWWLHHPQRLTYDGLVFEPGNADKVIAGKLNLWRGWGVEPAHGDWSLMRDHIRDVMVAGNAEMFAYVIKWLAWSVQHPDQRAEVALVFKGAKGTGKGTLGGAMCRIFGQHANHISSADQLAGKFNAHLRDCSFLFADEAYWPGDKSAEGSLKRMITEPTLWVEGKGVNGVEVPNYLHPMLASNEDWIIPAGENERRYVLNEVSRCHQQDPSWFKPLYAQMETGGYAAMLEALLREPLGDWHPRQIPADCGLLDQQRRSLPDLDAWWAELLESGTLAGCDPRHPNCARSGDYDEKVKSEDGGYDRHAKRSGLYSQARSIVPHLRQHTNASALADYLRARGCIVRERVRVLRRSGWEFPPLPDCRKDWARRFPGWAWRDPGLSEWRAADADDDPDAVADYIDATTPTFGKRKPKKPGHF